MKEKAMEKLKSADQYLEQHEKIFAVLSVAGLIALVIPFYWFGLYTVPMADDYSMVLGTHNAWEATHSVSRVLYSDGKPFYDMVRVVYRYVCAEPVAGTGRL